MSIVDAKKGTSAMEIGEILNQLLLENIQSYYLILSNGDYKVAKSERNMNCSIELNTQNDFWKNKLEVEKRKLNCCGWNDLLALVSCDSNKTNDTVIFPYSFWTLVKVAKTFSFYINEGGANTRLKENSGLVISLRESQLNLIHMNNIKLSDAAGALIVPSTSKWYAIQQFIKDIIDFIIVRFLDSLEAVINYKKMGWST